MNCELVPIRKFRVGRKTVWWCDAVWKYEDSSKAIRSKTLICSQDDHVGTETGLCEHTEEAERIRAREWLLEYKERFTTADDFIERLRSAVYDDADRRIESFRATFAKRAPNDQVWMSAFLEMYLAMSNAAEWVGQCDMDSISDEPLRVAVGYGNIENPDFARAMRALISEIHPSYFTGGIIRPDPFELPSWAEEWPYTQ